MYTSVPAVLLMGVLCAAAPTQDTGKQCLPVVDLGYELHQAISYNSTTDVFKFSNIRYGQAPVGDLRFRAPQSPLPNRQNIQNGSEPRTCPQGMPAWLARASPAIAKYSAGKPFSLEDWVKDITDAPSNVPSLNKPTSEDCLFLDVHVPKKVFQTGKTPGECSAPVLVFIHGGGYVLGSKTGYPNREFDPTGIMELAKKYNEEGMIFVSLNYRLGAFGFLAGDEVQADGDLNAGLLDQRLALDWVQQNIHLFGGSASRVTAMGESGGAYTVLQHMAANGGGDSSAPYAQAIAQSPAAAGLKEQTNATPDFLARLNVTTIAEARGLSSAALIQANEAQVGAAIPNSYIYTPVVDGSYVRAPIGKQLAAGEFDHNVRVLASHNSFEGSFFFDPDVKTNADFKQWVMQTLSGLSDISADYIVNELYPEQYDGSLGYVNAASRQMAVFGEAAIECNFLSVQEALGGHSFAYEFSIPAAMHTVDLSYTFSDSKNPALYPTAQKTLQEVIASFVMTGKPSNGNGPFPAWGTEQQVFNITQDGGFMSISQVNQTRCSWWQNEL